MEFRGSVEKSYLITGATGYIGSMIVKGLLANQCCDKCETEVILISRDLDRTYRMLQKLGVDSQNKKDRLHFSVIQADLTDVKAMLKINGQCDYMIHCASITKSKEMLLHPVEVIHSIVGTTQNMLELARRCGVKSFVYLSSMEVYGDISNPGDIGEDQLGLLDPLNVRNCYPMAKRMAENMCYCYYKEYGIPIKTARLAQTFGSGILPEDNRIYAQFANAACYGKDIILHTDGSSVGNYCEVQDAVNAILLILEKGMEGEAYNIVNEDLTMTIRQMAELVADKIMQKKINVKFDIPPGNDYGYPAPSKYRLSSRKLNDLGWNASKGMEEMYLDAIETIERETKVSIVIPIYNVDKYLNRCIDSAIGQTYNNIEILLINDGSTDDSESICREYETKDKRVSYYYHDNMGLARTRNLGIGLATGGYITFLDSDDWFETSFIEQLLSDMRSNQADIGLCDMNYVDDKSGVTHIVKLRFSQKKISMAQDKSIVNKSRLFAWGKVYRKSLFTDYQVEFPDIAYEDICTPLLIGHANAISYTPKPLINYLVNRKDSLSNDSKNISDIGKGLIWLKDRLVKDKLYGELHLEFKKIAMAQLRFAARRFGRTVDEAVQEDLSALVKVVENLLPDLQGIADNKYYVPDDSIILRHALDSCLPFENQIVSLKKDDDASLAIDEDMLKYNLAEMLMELM